MTRTSLAVVLVMAACAPTVRGRMADPGRPISVAPTEEKFTTPPGLPRCAKAATLSGDPTKGAAVVLLKLDSGCHVPWHWHTATEQLMVVSGSGTLEMKDGRSLALETGAYALLPSRHVHRARCSTACSFFAATDGVFDIHYVDEAGTEIPAKQALRD